MNGRFQRAAIVAQENKTAFSDALESASQTVDIDRVGKLLVRRANFLGVTSFRVLAFELCRWAEMEGVLDRLFPLEAVEDREQ